MKLHIFDKLEEVNKFLKNKKWDDLAYVDFKSIEARKEQHSGGDVTVTFIDRFFIIEK